MKYREYKERAEQTWRDEDGNLSSHLNREAEIAKAEGRPGIAAKLDKNAKWCRDGDSIHHRDCP